MKSKNINTTDKKYEYDYGSKFRCIISHLWGAYVNLSCALGFSVVLWCADAYFTTSKFGGEKIPEFLSVMITYIAALGTIFISLSLIIPIFLPKYVMLKSTHIKVRKTNLGPNHIFRGQFETIPYYLIKSCDYSNGTREKYSFGDYAVSFFNWDSLVQIVTINNKYYHIPVKNADDFIAEVNERRKRFQQQPENE